MSKKSCSQSKCNNTESQCTVQKPGAAIVRATVRVRASGVLTLTVTLTMLAPGYGYGIVAMAALGYGGPQSISVD